MASKNSTQVAIDGRIYTISGYESEDYLQRVAAYLNKKVSEVKELGGYSHMSPEMKALLLELNVADDYFKLKKDAEEVTAQIADKDKENYEVKHELVAAQMNLESARKDLSQLQEENQENQKKILELQTELRESGRTKEQLESELKELRKSREQLESELKELSKSRDQLESELKVQRRTKEHHG